MSMTLAEVAKRLKGLKNRCERLIVSSSAGSPEEWRKDAEAVEIAISALRPVSRERVERIWFREPYTRLETKCGENGDIVYSAVNTCMACGHETPIGNFCHNCGVAQNREAVQMVMERLEALHETV